MRILIDLRCLQGPPPRGGVGVLTEGMIRSLLAADHVNEYLLFANGLMDPRRHLPTFDAPNVRWIIRRIPNKLLNGVWSLGLHMWRFPRVDAFLVPNPNFLPKLPPNIPLVLVVHDLSFEHFRDCFTPKQRLLYRLMRPRELLHRADAIVAVSETTKRDVVETYGIPEAKVHVVYPGVEHSNATNADSNAPNAGVPEYSKHSDGIRSIRMFPGPFILSISELSPRKNLDGLIAAFELLTTHDSRLTPPPRLIIAGNHGSAEHVLRRQIARSPARDRIHLIGPVSENEKHALLARASCFVYPSLWEGFGFPPLEAMAAGVPVVASTGGALPEVLGDCSLLVDPLDPAAIADAIHRVLTDDALRNDLIARGHQRATQFRWDHAADQVHNILTSV